MSTPESTGEPSPEKRGRAAPPRPSWGNISDEHWSRARKDQNQEALEYYRKRSHAPGVEEGGAERNFYCMKCDGVIPFGFQGKNCPHCQVELDDKVRRYFNWVEINDPPKSDFRALLPIFVPLVLLLAGGAAFVVWWLVR